MAYPNEQAAGPSQPHPGPVPFAAPARSGRWQWLRLEGRPRPWRRSLAAAVAVAAAIVALGALLGLLWSRLAPPVPVVKLADGSIVVSDPSPEQYIAADGWFTLLGLGFGLIVTIVSWLVLRRDRGPFLLLGIVGGAFVAGRWVAPVVGEFLGRESYREWREVAAQGATYLAPPQVQALGPKLVPAFIAAVVLTLLAGWSNDPDLDHPGAKPGLGPHHGHPPEEAHDGRHTPYAVPGGEGSPYAVPGGEGSPYAVPGAEFSSYVPPQGDGQQAGRPNGSAAPERPATHGEAAEPRHPA